MLVEARVLARVLGVKLLTIDATVVLSPARVTPATASPAAAPPRRRAAGGSLAEATRQIDEGAALLAATRNGASREQERRGR